MRTLTADINVLASRQVAGAASSSWASQGASLIDTLQTWFLAAIGQYELRRLPERLLVDVLGDGASLRVESHVRDEFGRPIY